MGWIGWTLVLLTLTATGFMGARFFGLPGASETRSGPLPPLVPPAHAASPSAGEAGMGPRPADADEPATGSSAPTLVAHGREEERIAELGVEVPSGQGLLVLEPAPGEPAPRTSVELEGRRIALDTEPVALAVRPGVHHLRFTRGDHQDFVWVAVRPGHTRFVPPLP